MKEIRFEKEIEVGEYKFKVAVNRDIALKVSEQFPDFMATLLQTEESDADIQKVIKSNKLRDLIEKNDYVIENLAKVISFSLPLLLKEAKEKYNANEIISYTIENEVDEIFNIKLWEFILSVFTKGGLDKKPKVKFVMR